MSGARSDAVWSASDTTPGRDRGGDPPARRRAPPGERRLRPRARAEHGVRRRPRVERRGRQPPARASAATTPAARSCARSSRAARRSTRVASVASDVEPKHGEFALLRETIVVTVGERHVPALATIVAPLVVTDLATVVWSPHGHPEAVDALLGARAVGALRLGRRPRAACRAAPRERAEATACTSSTSRGCARRRGASASPRTSTRRRCAACCRRSAASPSATARARRCPALLTLGWLSSRLGWKPEGMVRHDGGFAGRRDRPAPGRHGADGGGRPVGARPVGGEDRRPPTARASRSSAAPAACTRGASRPTARSARGRCSAPRAARAASSARASGRRCCATRRSARRCAARRRSRHEADRRRRPAGRQPVPARSPTTRSCRTARRRALVAPNGNVEWMCLQRFDDPSVFGAMLDRDAGGFMRRAARRQRPRRRGATCPGTMIVETTWVTKTGWVIVRDLLVVGPWHDDSERSRHPPPRADRLGRRAHPAAHAALRERLGRDPPRVRADARLRPRAGRVGLRRRRLPPGDRARRGPGRRAHADDRPAPRASRTAAPARARRCARATSRTPRWRGARSRTRRRTRTPTRRSSRPRTSGTSGSPAATSPTTRGGRTCSARR